MNSPVLVSLISGLVLSISLSPVLAAEESPKKDKPFADHWQIIDILGNVVQIRDCYGKMHYKPEGESLEGVNIVEVDPESGSILVRNAADGREKRLQLSDARRPDAGPRRGSTIDGEIRGLDTRLREISIDQKPLKETLNLLSRATMQNFVTTAAVPDVPVTAKMSNVTVREILDTILGQYGLAWTEPEDECFIKIMTEEEKAKENQWVWELVECEVLAPPMVVQRLLPLLEPGERLEANMEKHGVAILALPPRRAALETEIRALEVKVRDWLEGQAGGITEKITGLKAEVPVFEVDNRPLADVMNLIGRFSGLNYIVHPTVRGLPVTAKLQNVTVRDILDMVLPHYGCRWEPTANLKSIRIVPDSQPTRVGVFSRPSYVDPPSRASAPLIEAPTQEITELLPELKTVIPQLEFEDQPVKLILNSLSKESGLNFIGLGMIPEKKISARLNGLTVREILDALMPEYGCRWDVVPESHSIMFGPYHEGPPRVVPAE